MASFSHPRFRAPRRGQVTAEMLEPRRLLSAGDLDLTFGGDGTVTTDFVGATRDRGRGILVQPDGKVVVAGSVEVWESDESAFAVTRYNEDGSADLGFGDGGRVVFDFGGRFAQPFDVALAPGNKIVVTGISSPSKGFYPREQDFALARLHPDGRLDNTFSGDGKLQIDFGGTDVARAVAVRPDGKVVAAGYTTAVTGAFQGIALARVNEDGTLDTTFGGSGTGKVANVPGGVRDGARGNDLALDPAGRLVVAGSVAQRFAVTRFTPDGAPDAAFGNGGVAGGPGSEAAAVALAPAGKIVAAGASGVARYNDDGSLDPTFGGDGTYDLPAGSPFRFSPDARSVLAADAQGRVVLGGYDAVFGPNFRTWVVLLRLDASGAPDPTFGENGVSTGGDGEVLALTMDAAGRPVVTGGTPGEGSWPDFLVERHTADGAPDGSFGSGGRTATAFRSSTTNRGYGVAVQPDGKVVVGGTTYPGEGPQQWATATVVRYLVDGSLDPAFGDGGRARPVSGLPTFVLRTLALQPDGRILAAGQALVRPPGAATTRWVVGVIRYLADGSPDPTFGDGGKVTFAFVEAQNFTEEARGLAVQADGRIVVAGSSGGGAAVARLMPSGAPDPTFGTGGRSYTPPIDYGNGFYGWTRVTDLALGPGGTIVLGGATGNDVVRPGTLSVIRYDAAGRLDRTFGGDGVVGLFVRGSWDDDINVVVAPDGSVVVGSVTSAPRVAGQWPDTDFALLRLHPDGSRDTGFGGLGPDPGDDDPEAGVVKTDFDEGDDFLHDLLMLPDGSLIAAGLASPGGGRFDRYADDPGPTRFALARYTPWGELDPVFGNAGRVMTAFGDGMREEEAYAVALAPGDKLVAAGTAAVAGRGEDFAVARYHLVGSTPPNPYVRGRYVFYNNSVYDGGNPLANPADDNAIATDKRALVAPPGMGAATVLATAVADNVTSFTRGITGIMVDVGGGPAGATLFLNLSARVRGPGGDDDWQSQSFLDWSLRPRAGAGGSDRLVVTFPDGAIRNTWVEVALDVAMDGVILHQEVFYFGNLAGETAETGGTAGSGLRVNALDLAAVKRALNTASTVRGKYDLNRDGRVNALDLAAVRQNLGAALEFGTVESVLAAPVPTKPAPLEVGRVWREEE